MTTSPAAHSPSTSAAPLEHLAAEIATRIHADRRRVGAWHRPVGLLVTALAIVLVVSSPGCIPWLLIAAAGLVAAASAARGLAAFGGLVHALHDLEPREGSDGRLG